MGSMPGEESGTAAADPTRFPAARKRVLIAEDDRDIRELVATKLRSVGLEVIEVTDGTAALEAIRTDRPDLVLLDVMMPGLSGLDVIEELRSSALTVDLPAILLTARSQEFDVQAGLSLGATDYVVKPFSPRDLVDRVQAALLAAAG
jgi:DNA-binding response OmpR family regulator